MPADIYAENLLFGTEQNIKLKLRFHIGLIRFGNRVHHASAVIPAEIKKRKLSRFKSFSFGGGRSELLFKMSRQIFSRNAETIETASLYKPLQQAFVQPVGSSSEEIRKIRKRSAAAPLLQHIVHRSLSDVAYRGKAEPYSTVFNRKTCLAAVYIRRKNSYSVLAAIINIERDPVRRSKIAVDERRHELRRVQAFEQRGSISNHRVARRMSLVECI